MPSTLPPGEPAPPDGSLPDSALEGVGGRVFGFYVHVPFCTVRCGYCDFNTYTAEELGPGVSRASFAATAIEEIRLARRVLGERDVPVSTVFFGGGTPTLLGPADLGAVLDAVDGEFGLAVDAEVTTESNPDSVRPGDLEKLVAAGLNRISFGMQSAVDHVLKTLDRTHDPARVPQVVAEARAAGFGQVSLDLIYGTPGESVADWEASLDAALACEPDHLSAYSLIVEDGTALARRVRRGELPMPDEDDLADKYLLTDERLAAAGHEWYEVSNWARDEAARCRHNLGYWRGADWWGAGPGAHSHVGGSAGGTSSTPPRTPTGWPRARARRTPARSSMTRPAGSSGCCSSSGSATAWTSGFSTPPVARPCRAWSTAASRWSRRTGWC